jgi:hypothetical protein
MSSTIVPRVSVSTMDIPNIPGLVVYFPPEKKYTLVWKKYFREIEQMEKEILFSDVHQQLLMSVEKIE